MHVCHFSDWHGGFYKLPAADLYICTGDMFPNSPLITFELDGKLFNWQTRVGVPRPPGNYIDRKIDPLFEQQQQKLWVEQNRGQYRKLFGNPNSPVVCVRGNHDFIDLSEAFDGEVWEVNMDPTRATSVGDLKIGRCRGINRLQDEWSDELQDQDWYDTVKKLPLDLDLLITHAPPAGILDTVSSAGSFAQVKEHLGSKALNGYLNQRMYVGKKMIAHFFGHIHESNGSQVEEDVLFSNAATTHAVYHL